MQDIQILVHWLANVVKYVRLLESNVRIESTEIGGSIQIEHVTRWWQKALSEITVVFQMI